MDAMAGVDSTVAGTDAAAEWFESSDNNLFSAILRSPHHVLHPLLPPLNTTVYHLRKRNHGLELSAVQSSSFEEKFYIPNAVH